MHIICNYMYIWEVLSLSTCIINVIMLYDEIACCVFCIFCNMIKANCVCTLLYYKFCQWYVLFCFTYITTAHVIWSVLFCYITTVHVVWSVLFCYITTARVVWYVLFCYMTTVRVVWYVLFCYMTARVVSSVLSCYITTSHVVWSVLFCYMTTARVVWSVLFCNMAVTVVWLCKVHIYEWIASNSRVDPSTIDFPTLSPRTSPSRLSVPTKGSTG